MRYFLSIGVGTIMVLAPHYLGAQEAPAPAAKTSTKTAKKTSEKKPAKGVASAKTTPAPKKGASKSVRAKAGSGMAKLPPSKRATGKVAKGPKPMALSTTLRPRGNDGRVPVRSLAPSIQGPTGLDRVWSADTGPVGTLRMRFSLSWFGAEDFPVSGQSNLFIGTDLAVAYTPHRWVETFLGVRGTSNTNEGEEPSLIQTQGDISLGVKSGFEVSPSIRLGGALAMRLLSGMGGGGFVGSAMSLDARLLSTFDLTRSQNVPLRIHLELGNYFENSEAVTDDLPQEPSIVQEFGLQVARYDRLTLGLAIESPFNQYFSPFLEYRITKPHFVEISRRGEGSNDYSFGSVPHNITIGMRGFPIEHLALDLGVRIGFSDSPHTGVPATPPYTILFGVAYTLDPRPKLMTKIIEKKVAAPVTKAVKSRGQIAGRVIDAKTKSPLSEAQVSYPGAGALSPQVTGRDGAFRGYRFQAGVIDLSASAKGYKPGRGKATVVVGKTAKVVIALQPDPAQQSGKVEIRVFGRGGKGVNASISFSGKATGVSGVATAKAPFKESVPAGKHPVTITAKGYDPLRTIAAVKGGQANSLRYTLTKGGKRKAPGARRRAAPRRPRAARAPRAAGAPRATGPTRAGGRLAIVSTRGIKLKDRVSFKPRSAVLTPQGKAVLDDVAKGLKRVKRIKQVRIAAHVSGMGSRDNDSRLSIARARTVKNHLVQRGISTGRLQARGYGGLKPVSPSITNRGRVRNERIDFVILRK